MKEVKKMFPILIGLIGMTAVPGVAAADDGYKIGVVDLLRVLEEVPQALKARKQIEAEFAGKEEDMNSMTKKLRDMEGKLAKDSAVMNDKEQRDLERDIISSRREIKRLQEKYREDLNYRRNEELSKLQGLIRETIQTLAKKEEFDMILGEGLLYVDPDIDVTKQVITELAKQSGEADKNAEKSRKESDSDKD